MELDKKLFEDAIVFAVEAHRGQIRKGNGAPYVIHPIEVMMTLREVKETQYPYLLGTCALLHDVVEDTGIPLSMIQDKFGIQVAAVVGELSSDKSQIESKGKDLYLWEKIQTISSWGRTIKLVDRLVNLRDCVQMGVEFKTKTYTGTQMLIAGALKTKLTKTQINIISLMEPILIKMKSECNILS